MKGTYVLVSLFAAAWVFYDAKTRGKGNIMAFLWFLGTQAMMPLVLPVWLLFRPGR